MVVDTYLEIVGSNDFKNQSMRKGVQGRGIFKVDITKVLSLVPLIDMVFYVDGNGLVTHSKDVETCVMT